MAGIKEAIQSIIARLQTVSQLQHVRVWNSQVDYENDGKLYDFPKPAAFVGTRIPNIHQPLGGNYSQSDIVFIIHLIHEQYDAGGGTFEQNYDVFDVRAEILKSLTGFQPTQCGSLMKISESQDETHTNIYHYQIEFITGMIDTDGIPVSNTIVKDPPTDLTVDVNVEASIPEADNQPYRKIKLKNN